MSASTPLPCLDCGVNTSGARDRKDAIGEYYHVHEAVWFEAFGASQHDPWPERHAVSEAGYLCIGCLEQRLGRVLTPADFSGAPVNNPMVSRKSERIMQRMFGGGPNS